MMNAKYTEERWTKGTAPTLGLLLAVLVAACLLMAAKPSHAATTFAVDRQDDPDPATAKACTDAPNDCSLRGAIVAANAAAGADAVALPAGTYTLTREGYFEEAASTGDLDVTGELTITGAGARTTSVVGGPAPYDDRIFDNRPGAKTTITGLTVTGGDIGAYEGGGIRNQNDLTLDGVAVESNTAGIGGGIDSRGGDLTLDKVTFKDNTASASAGGIYSQNGALNVTDSTVSGNSSGEYAGGIAQYSGTVNITNSTISGNNAAQAGGGILAASATTNVRNSTIASNEAGGLGGGILTTTGSTVVLKNTIVSGNSLLNCDTSLAGGIIFSQGNNMSSDESCPFTRSTDKQNTNPLLSPLANNGGPSDTHALLSESPAIDAGTNTDCPTTDQRGVARPQGLRCDIGAFERANSAPTARNNSYRGKEDRTLRVPARGVLGNDTDPDGDALSAARVSGPSKGKLSLNPNGSFSYTPQRNFNGTVRFVYLAGDGRGGTGTATVSIRIEARPG